MERKLIKTVPFILQLHEAYRAGRHYDLRIQYLHKSKLASWAIPKADIPRKSGDGVAAIRTPDHDKSWLKFQGEIPRGEYGGGRVTIAQSGPAGIYGWTDNLIIFVVSGNIMNGKYVLVKMKPTGRQEGWLLVKGKD
jgi:bifunctional non-homologous end joining protein LigD